MNDKIGEKNVTPEFIYSFHIYSIDINSNGKLGREIQEIKEIEKR